MKTRREIRTGGFAKIEVRQGQCRMELQLRGVPDGAGEVYLLTGPGNDICGIRIGELQIRSGAGRQTFVFAADAVGDTAYGLDVYERDLSVRGRGPFLPPASGAMRRWTGEASIYMKNQKTERHMQKRNRRETPETEPETVPEQEGDSETGQQKEPEPETGAEIHAAQTAAAEAPARGGKIAAVREPAWEQQWKRFAAAHPVFCPYDEAQDIYAVKMDLRDLRSCRKNICRWRITAFCFTAISIINSCCSGIWGSRRKNGF